VTAPSRSQQLRRFRNEATHDRNSTDQPVPNPEGDRHAATDPIAHVKTLCPALIATLVAIAREAQDDAKLVTDEAARGTADGAL
jgi:hypothetical protein